MLNQETEVVPEHTAAAEPPAAAECSVLIDRSEELHTTVVQISGAVDRQAADRMRVWLRKATSFGGERILVDLSECTAFDPVAIDALVQAHWALVRGRVVVVANHRDVIQNLRFAGVDRVIPVMKDRQEGLNRLL
jgi:anti-anti-sigma factor